MSLSCVQLTRVIISIERSSDSSYFKFVYSFYFTKHW